MAGQSIDNAFTAPALKGAAGDPTYAGVPSFMRRKFSKTETADLTVWGVPFDASVSNRPGARFGPQAIRRASTIFDNDPQYPFKADLFVDFAVVDHGDCLLDYRLPETAHATIEREARRILERTGFLLTLGGDHSITCPLLRAHSAKHGPLALVHFDAHQDTWPIATAPDGSRRVDHGSFLLAAVEEGLVDPAASIQIGIRTHAPEECGVEIIHGYDVEELGAKAIAERIRARVGDRKAYLTFDIDCLDVAFAPGTGTPVAGGPSSAKMLAVLKHLKGLDIVGADVVEVSPPYDHAEMTAIAAATVALYIVGLHAERLGVI